jgi:cysteine-rich repeat protein
MKIVHFPTGPGGSDGSAGHRTFGAPRMGFAVQAAGMGRASCLVFAVFAACGAPSSSGTPDGGGTDPDGSEQIPATCGNGAMDPGEECDDGNDNRFDGCRPNCTAVAPIQPTAMTWQYFEIPGTKCIDGTPAGFAVNYNPASTKLVFYLEAGGACFNSLCESLHHPGPNIPEDSSGIFDRTNTANPVRDWSWVYVPYCSGDVYAGQAETMLAGKLRYFYGYSNITAFLERMVPAFDVDQVLLTGSSAGGFGSAINYPQTQRAFGSVPVVWIDDSAPPMSTAVYPPCLQDTWRTVWRLDKTVLAECGSDCTDPSSFSEDMFAHVRKTFPSMRGGLYSTLSDQTIRAFAGYGWSNGYNKCGEFSTAVTATVYQSGLTELRTNMTPTAGLGTFYIAGTSHTRLRSASFYTTQVGSTTLPQWVASTLAGTSSHVGP